MKAVVFSGTTEGRRLSAELAGMGLQVTACVATGYGAEEQEKTAGPVVHTGRLEPCEMAALLKDAAVCVDATHPYAVQATANIRQAAAMAGVPYKRLLRPRSKLPAGSRTVQSAAEAAQFLLSAGGPVLLATGAKELAAFARLDPARLYPRVLPTAENIRACEAAGIPHRNIIAMQGPFGRELNLAILRQYQIRWMVTKDGGAQGGFAEKAAAAQAASAKLVVIERPPEKGESEAEILAFCKGLIQ